MVYKLSKEEKLIILDALCDATYAKPRLTYRQNQRYCKLYQKLGQEWI
jgi:hypothetical protein